MRAVRYRGSMGIPVCFSVLVVGQCAHRFFCTSMTNKEFIHLVMVLQLPDKIFTHGGYHLDSIEAFALTCTQLTSPSDKFSLCACYNSSQSSISEIFNKLITILDKHWGYLLNFDSDHLLSPKNLQHYSTAIFESRAPL